MVFKKDLFYLRLMTKLTRDAALLGGKDCRVVGDVRPRGRKRPRVGGGRTGRYGDSL